MVTKTHPTNDNSTNNNSTTGNSTTVSTTSTCSTTDVSRREKLPGLPPSKTPQADLVRRALAQFAWEEKQEEETKARTDEIRAKKKSHNILVGQPEGKTLGSSPGTEKVKKSKLHQDERIDEDVHKVGLATGSLGLLGTGDTVGSSLAQGMSPNANELISGGAGLDFTGVLGAGNDLVSAGGHTRALLKAENNPERKEALKDLGQDTLDLVQDLAKTGKGASMITNAVQHGSQAVQHGSPVFMPTPILGTIASGTSLIQN